MASTTAIKVSRDVAKKIVEAGGPTFSPRRRNRLGCNQAPEFGALSRAQADLVRNQVRDWFPPEPVNGPEPMVPPVRTPQPQPRFTQSRPTQAVATPQLQPEGPVEHSQQWSQWGQSCPSCWTLFYVSHLSIYFSGPETVSCPKCQRQFRVTL